jgi:type IV pilus assembly protein PilZ
MTQEQKPGIDGRLETRAPIELKVDYKKLNSFFADYTKNISKGGTFIKTKKPLPVGTRFLFKLTVPQRAEAFELLATVRSQAWESNLSIPPRRSAANLRPS